MDTEYVDKLKLHIRNRVVQRGVVTRGQSIDEIIEILYECIDAAMYATAADYETINQCIELWDRSRGATVRWRAWIDTMHRDPFGRIFEYGKLMMYVGVRCSTTTNMDGVMQLLTDRETADGLIEYFIGLGTDNSIDVPSYILNRVDVSDIHDRTKVDINPDLIIDLYPYIERDCKSRKFPACLNLTYL